MGDNDKRISIEEMIQMTKKLKMGKRVICPLCECGIMESVIEDFKISHCFVCNSCGEKLNIN